MPRPATVSVGFLFGPILACALLLPAGAAPAAEAPQVARDLRSDAQVAAQYQQPLLLFFTLADCPFCAGARREYIGPMAHNPQESARALYREIPIEATLIGFDGTPLAARDLAARLGVTIFPTVVLVDGQGRALAPLLAGYTSPDFYGAYLEDRIAAAVQKTKQ
jgi:thioredoxin-related protein